MSSRKIDVVPQEAEHHADASALPDTRGLDFFQADLSFRQVLPLYLAADVAAHLWPHLRRLAAMLGGKLDALADAADKNPPVLHHRDRRGIDRQWIEKHPAYEEMERIAFGEFGLAAMSHRGGVLGWPEPLPPAAKYALTYLLVQAEFGLCCPVSMTDSLTRSLVKFGDPALVARYLPALTSQDLDASAQGAMFMTEQHAGSDVGQVQTVARRERGEWRLYGDKWFCSNADADLAMVLARPEGAGPGTKGLGLFLLPRNLPDGSQNAYRIVRLKNKLGTRSMASGEIKLEGALAYPIGDMAKGFVQMADMINNSRLSNGVRAAGLMRRALTEARHVARERVAFGKRLEDLPLMRRQLLKLMVPTEQALSFFLYTAETLRRADAGETAAKPLARILTPLIKYRACRDARKVTGDAMEVRGGAGYIEEWIDPRLLRDSHLGSIWEGTSNVVALDVLRSARKDGAHHKLAEALVAELAATRGLAKAQVALFGGPLQRAADFIDSAIKAKLSDRLARQGAALLYHATSAVLMAREAFAIHAASGDARRLLLARLVLDHRLSARDAFAADDADWFSEVAGLLLSDKPVPLEKALSLSAR
ncbi:MAG TPA: acyl-CoA dehydrogenase family protein [Candidatus Cybelea sp.]|nr:acyl-CoA dehydrogenase family protein [Candidatus Cybelea sp.]